MATFEGMKIPPEMKSYIKTTLEPLLEDMVSAMSFRKRELQQRSAAMTLLSPPLLNLSNFAMIVANDVLVFDEIEDRLQFKF